MFVPGGGEGVPRLVISSGPGIALLIFHGQPARLRETAAQSMQTPVEYYVLKQGHTKGPFTEAEIVDQLASGIFSFEDLGQTSGARYWTPLRRIFGENGGNNTDIPIEALEKEGSLSIPPSLPQGFTAEVLQWWRSTSGGIQHLFQRHPFEFGIAFLALGCVLLLLSYIPIFIIGPALAGALFGGGLTMLRGRVIAGLSLCGAAVFIPALIWSAFVWIGRALSMSQ